MNDEEVEATPAAEAKAEELGVDLTEVEGSGQDDRVLVSDVVEAAAGEGGRTHEEWEAQVAQDEKEEAEREAARRKQAEYEAQVDAEALAEREAAAGE